MNIALIQADLHWENPLQNQLDFETKINTLPNSIDLIILPEMFTTGFTTNPSAVAQTMQGQTVCWMQKIAKNKNCAITGSIVITDQKQYYNRLVFVYPDTSVQFYDKRHLFSLAAEDKAYTAGTKKIIIPYKGWKICPQICYDLRFPVFSRNTENYDLLLYVANWPKARISAWDTLLRARAIENITYTIGVNRVGVDYNQLSYNGHSQAIDYLGNVLHTIADNEGIVLVTLDKLLQQTTRDKLNYLNDKDTFVFTQ